jgi:hypothetical protein
MPLVPPDLIPIAAVTVGQKVWTFAKGRWCPCEVMNTRLHAVHVVNQLLQIDTWVDITHLRIRTSDPPRS